MAGAQARRILISVKAINRDANRELRETERAADRTERSFRSLDQRADALEGTFQLLGAATVAVGYGLQQIISNGMGVEKTMKMVEATSGASAAEMAAMQAEVQRLGRDLPVTMQDSADALKELSFAGFSATESIAAVGGVAELASASTLTVAQSAEVTANTLNTFSLEADRAQSVADAMAGTFSSSSVTMEQYAEAMSYVGQAAASAGQNITQTSAAIGILGDAGLKGSRAGTSLQQTLASLADPSDKAQGALEDLGIQMSDLTDEQGNFKDMTDIVALFATRLEGLPDQKRLEYLTSIFGLRGARAMQALTDNTEEFVNRVKSVSASEIAGGMDQLREMDASGIQAINEELRKLAEREGMATTFQLRPNMSREAMLREVQAVSGDLSEEELALQIQAAFNVDEEAGQRLAQELQAGTDVGTIAESLREAQTAGGLAEAQMSTLSGKIEYLKGTIDSLSFSAFLAIKPILYPILDGLISVGDELAKHPNLAKAAGVAFLGLFGALAAGTLIVGALIVETYLLQTAQLASAHGARSYAVAEKAANAVRWTATAATNALSLSYWRNATASAAATTKQYALAAAYRVGRLSAYASAAASWTYTTATNAVAAAQVRTRAATIASTAATYGYRAAMLAASGAAWLASGGISAAGTAAGVASTAMTVGGSAATLLAGGLSTAATAAYGFLAALGPIGWAIIAIGAIAIGVKTNFLGMGDAFDWVVGQISGGVNALLNPMQTLDSATRAVGGAIDWVVDHASTFLRIASLLTPIGLSAWVLKAATGFDVFGAAAQFATDPLGTIHGWLTKLANFDLSDIPIVGGLLQKGVKAGQGLAEGFSKGAQGKKGLVAKAAGGLMGTAASFLPGSNADRGPLSDLFARGGALAEHFASGARSREGAVGAAAGSIAQTAGRELPGGATGSRQAAALVDALSRQLSSFAPAPLGLPAPAVAQPTIPTPAAPSSTPTISPSVETPSVAAGAVAPEQSPSVQVQPSVADPAAVRGAIGGVADLADTADIAQPLNRLGGAIGTDAEALADQRPTVETPSAIGVDAPSSISVDEPALPDSIGIDDPRLRRHPALRGPETPAAGDATGSAAVALTDVAQSATVANVTPPTPAPTPTAGGGDGAVVASSPTVNTSVEAPSIPDQSGTAPQNAVEETTEQPIEVNLSQEISIEVGGGDEETATETRDAVRQANDELVQDIEDVFANLTKTN